MQATAQSPCPELNTLLTTPLIQPYLLHLLLDPTMHHAQTHQLPTPLVFPQAAHLTPFTTPGHMGLTWLQGCRFGVLVCGTLVYSRGDEVQSKRDHLDYEAHAAEEGQAQPSLLMPGQCLHPFASESKLNPRTTPPLLFDLRPSMSMTLCLHRQTSLVVYNTGSKHSCSRREECSSITKTATCGSKGCIRGSMLLIGSLCLCCLLLSRPMHASVTAVQQCCWHTWSLLGEQLN